MIYVASTYFGGNMKTLTLTTIALIASLTNFSAHSAQVVKSLPDNMVGKGVGGTSSMLIGGAIAGPIGAAVAGIAGIFVGEQIQQTTGNSGNAYQVKLEDGTLATFRSPNFSFNVGDEVRVDGIRIYPVTNK